MKSAVTIKAAALAFGALFIGAAAQTIFAQEGRQPEAQRQPGQMERSQQGQAPSAKRQADRDQWGITDELTEGWIIVKLAARPGLDNIDVEVEDGVATVSGQVGSEVAQNRALRIANRTMGVQSVRNKITVDSSARETKVKEVPDQQLAQQVAREIADNIEGAKSGKDWWFDGWRIEGPYNRWNFVVEADEGNITLEGEVPDVDIMRKAVESAREVPGVRTVDSELELERYYGYGRYPYRGPYYGRAYPYHPYVMPPYAWGPQEPSERFARGERNQQQSQESR